MHSPWVDISKPAVGMALITLRFHFLSIAKVSGVGKFDFDSGTLALSGLSAVYLCQKVFYFPVLALVFVHQVLAS